MNTPKELLEARPKITDISAMEDLLEKTRRLNRALQMSDGKEFPDYQKLAKLISEISTANVYVVNYFGKVLGHAFLNKYECTIMTDMLEKASLPGNYVDKLNQMHESVLNHSDNGFCSYSDMKCTYLNKTSLYVPINGSGNRLGTLILVRFGEEFDVRDLVLAEYIATVFGIEILNERNKYIEDCSRERLVVQMAMRALSYSEIESIRHIIENMDGAEGVVVASKVADKVGVTRSVIVNALRKLGSAGIIESRSLGMKGTYIKVLSSLLIDELGIKDFAKQNSGR